MLYAGIPVTHRDTNQAVTFITGHGVDGNIPALDWNAVSRGSPTLVLYMALAHADEIAAKLIAAGRPASEPAAIVSDATSGKQNVRVTTLGRAWRMRKGKRCARHPRHRRECVKLREGLDWIGAMSGKLLDADPLKRDKLSDAI